ncbi:hypothetical protein, conserved [Angomonas deanei]|uniref:Uncharacterized protein n=1 Tax=Angomonas deanei TaxID=59799 RepID=A0A7G2C148_9TRYP|nr:hypothetical protein, conserved [Angomonas deanei]
MEREEDGKTRKEMYAEDDGVGEKPRGLPGNRPIKRIYKMPPGTKQEEFEEYAKGYISTLFVDESLVTLTADLTETSAAIPEPDTKKKRVAAVQRAPNHCLVTAWKVEPYFEGVKGVPEGYDKMHHIQKFSSVLHVGMNDKLVNTTKVSIMNHCINNNTFVTDRAFPSTTCAIDVVETIKETLNPFETAEKTLTHRRDLIAQSEENSQLILTMYNALSPLGMQPGAYMKDVIALMYDHPEVIEAVRSFISVVQEKLNVCTTKLDSMNKHPEQYAMVLKAATDIECALIAMDSEVVERE